LTTDRNEPVRVEVWRDRSLQVSMERIDLEIDAARALDGDGHRVARADIDHRLTYWAV
jgi:hypothetical protein